MDIQGNALGEIKIELTAMKTEVQRLDRVATENKTELSQRITAMQHKIDAALKTTEQTFIIYCSAGCPLWKIH